MTRAPVRTTGTVSNTVATAKGKELKALAHSTDYSRLKALAISASDYSKMRQSGACWNSLPIICLTLPPEHIIFSHPRVTIFIEAR